MSDDDNISKIYQSGQQSVWKDLLQLALRNLPEAKPESYRMERLDTISWLRTRCELYGDNDWPDDLHLADVVAEACKAERLESVGFLGTTFAMSRSFSSEISIFLISPSRILAEVTASVARSAATIEPSTIFDELTESPASFARVTLPSVMVVYWFFSPCKVATEFSSLRATSVSSWGGEAPGKAALMVMVGSSISGNC